MTLPQKLQICKNWAIFVKSEDHKRIIPQIKMNYANIPYDSTLHLYRGSSTRPSSIAEAGLEIVRKAYTLVQRKINISYAMVSVQFVSTTMPAKQKQSRKVNHQISLTTSTQWKGLNLLVRKAETIFGSQSLSHHYVPVSTLEECVESCQRR